MSDTLNKLHLLFELFDHPRPPIVTGDGETVSVQWCPATYPSQADMPSPPDLVELGFPTEGLLPDLEPYPNDGMVWTRFPIRRLADILDRHGGIAGEKVVA